MRHNLFAAVLSVTFWVFAGTADANLLTNGGFELGGSIPTDWSSGYSGSSPNSHVIFPTNASNARTGDRYAELAIDSSDSYAFAAAHNNSGTPGTEYKLSAWLKKASGSADGTVSLKLEFYGGLNKADPKGDSSSGIYSNPTDWTYLEHTDIAPVGTNYITATLILSSPSSGVNTAWYDDVELVEVAGGTSTDFMGGSKVLFNEHLICSNGHIHQEFQEVTQKIMVLRICHAKYSVWDVLCR